MRGWRDRLDEGELTCRQGDDGRLKETVLKNDVWKNPTRRRLRWDSLWGFLIILCAVLIVLSDINSVFCCLLISNGDIVSLSAYGWQM